MRSQLLPILHGSFHKPVIHFRLVAEASAVKVDYWPPNKYSIYSRELTNPTNIGESSSQITRQRAILVSALERRSTIQGCTYTGTSLNRKHHPKKYHSCSCHFHLHLNYSKTVNAQSGLLLSVAISSWTQPNSRTSLMTNILGVSKGFSAHTAGCKSLSLSLCN